MSRLAPHTHLPVLPERAAALPVSDSQPLPAPPPCTCPGLQAARACWRRWRRLRSSGHTGRWVLHRSILLRHAWLSHPPACISARTWCCAGNRLQRVPCLCSTQGLLVHHKGPLSPHPAATPKPCQLSEDRRMDAVTNMEINRAALLQYALTKKVGRQAGRDMRAAYLWAGRLVGTCVQPTRGQPGAAMLPTLVGIHATGSPGVPKCRWRRRRRWSRLKPSWQR